jgi:GAF domain-containing protein/HAMP domain-containing protein
MTESNPLHTSALDQGRISPAGSDEQVKVSATWAAALLSVAAVVFFLYALVSVNFHDFEDYILVGFPVILAATSLSSILLMRRGRLGLGSGLVFGMNLLVPFLLVSILKNSFWSAFLYGTVSSALLTWRGLPRRYWGRAVIATLAVLFWVTVISVMDPQGRLKPTAELDLLFGVVIVALLAAFIVQAVRQTWGRSMRNKLLVAFIASTLVGTGILAAYVFNSTGTLLRNSLEDQLLEHTDEAALRIGSLLNEQLKTLSTLSLNEVLEESIEEANAAYPAGTAAIQAELERRDAEWRAADAADNDAAPLVRDRLDNPAAFELNEFKGAFPAHVEMFITDVYGGEVGTTDRTSDYYQADEDWWQAAYNNGQGAIYISEPEFDESAGALAVLIALPVRSDETGELIGILRTTFVMSALDTILSEQVGETGKTELIIPGDPVMHFSDGKLNVVESAEHEALQAASQGLVTLDYEGRASVVLQAPVRTAEGSPIVDELGWAVVYHQDQGEAFAAINTQTRGVILVIAFVLLLAVVIAVALSIFLVRPIAQLTQTAEEIGAGILTSRAAVNSTDEVGILAASFNNMTARLQETLGGLEQRVADRTRNLELAAEVGRAVSQVRALDIMLKDACELILKEFNLYYVQVYLADPSGSRLKLEAGTGEVGAQLVERGHSLPLNIGSINGRAAVEKRSMVISDTAQSATFRKNPLLPETRGEMAVPLIIADKVVGVLDMQSSQPGALTDEVLPAFEALAGQLAVAVQNANLLAETEQARTQVEAQARRLVRAGWNEHLDAIHKPEQLGFVFDHNTVAPLAETNESQLPEDGKAISVPIAVTGESLGSLVVEIGEEGRLEQMNELVSVVARQVAQQIENLRLLESAERYRYEAEQAARLQTIEGWRDYLNSRSTQELGYLYDLQEVRPSSNGHDDPNALTVPVKARDEQVGKLAVQGLTLENREEVELANLVAERLGAHLESLRLTEQTQKRAYELEAVAAVSTTASSTLDPAQLLQSVVNLTKERFGLYHAHVYLLNDAGDTLELAAGAGEVGKQMVAEGWRIPIDHPESIVARTARQRQSAIANNIVRDAESQFLSNRLLPNTRSEMAVPLIVGDTVLGVFDVQADTAGRFTEDDIRIQTTLAAQVAVAVQNARSFAQAQKQAQREAMLNAINQKIQGATSVEAVLQIAARELGHALGAPMTVAQLSMKDKS